MPQITDEEVYKYIRQGVIKPIYFLFGEESRFILMAVQRIIDKTVNKGTQGFNLIQFNGDNLDLNSLEQAVESMPFMAEQKVVTVSDIDFDKMLKDDFETLTGILENPNESTVLIIYSTRITYDLKKSSRTNKIIKLSAQSGFVCNFQHKDKATIKKQLAMRAKKDGITLDGKTADFLIDRCSFDYTLLLNELEKLISYTIANNQTQITKQAIIDCCTQSVEASIFDLAGAIINKNSQKAFMLIDELFNQRIHPILMVSILNTSFNDLYRARVALNQGISANAVIEDFKYSKNRQFVVRNAFRDVQNFSVERLRYCFDVLLKTDIKLKSSKNDERVIFETAVASMI